MLTDNIDAGVTVNAKMKQIVVECVAFKKVKMNEQRQNKVTKKIGTFREKTKQMVEASDHVLQQHPHDE